MREKLFSPLERNLDEIILYVFAMAAITKYHRLGGFSKGNLFSHWVATGYKVINPEGYKSEIKVLAGLTFFPLRLLSLTHKGLYFQSLYSLSSVNVAVEIPFYYREAIIELEPLHMT